MTTTEAGEAALGLSYLVFTLVLTLYYLKMLSPVLSNDLWWERFNASGAQSYVIDVYNGQLNLVTHGTVDFTSPVFGISKDYSTYYTPIEVTPTYPRMVAHAHSHDIAAIITNLRTFSGPEALDTQYCWLDFNRTWEVAHTSMRQKRCQTRYIQNAAMFWETTARLVNWKTFMDKREGEWNVTVADGLRKTPEGRAWLARTPNAFKDLPTEMALWKQAGLTYFTLQYMNAVTWSVTETMSIANAFGSHEAISNKRMTGKDRDWSLWMYQWSPGNDIYVAQACGYSFIRSDSANQQFTYPCDYADYLVNPANYTCDPCNSPWNPVPGDCAPDWEWMMGMPDVPIVQMVRSNVGPFGSIDAFFVPAPASLKTLYATFHTHLTELAQSNQAFHNALVSIPGYHADPVPPSWLNPSYEYMGGDPSCTDRQPLPFVQSSMAFDIACTDQSRHMMLLHRFNTLFALWASKASPRTICSLCPTLASVCLSVVVPSATALDLFNNNAVAPPSDSLVQVAKADIVTLNVGTLQFAFNIVDSSNVFLTQPLLASTLSTWDAFGWVYLYEWAAGIREVVSIEGDRGVFPVVSNTYDPIINEAGALEVPKSACHYLWIISVTVSAILVSVGAIFTFYTVLMRFRIVGRNLFRFNRIVGAVWLGRPLLLVRGMTAVVLLSTSPLDFGVIHGFTRFEFAPRTFVESMIVSGEAMWISYVIHDVLLLFTRHYELHFAPISTGLCWLVYVIIDVASPYKIEATLDQLCTVDYRICGIRCTSGAISMGNVKRAMMLLVIQVVCIAVAFCVVKVWQCVRPTQSAKSAFTGHLLLSGSATAFLHKETTEKGAWMVDRAACVMCGLLTFRSYFFDTKLWLLLVDQDANEVVKWNKKLFEPPELNLALRDDEADVSMYASKVVQIRLETSSRKRFFAMAAGLGYVFATIFASVTYLTLTSTNMTNDFWWANYNASREHVYVARMYNSQLLYRPHGGTVSLDSTIFVDDADYNSSLAKGVEVTMVSLYVSQVKSTDGSDMATVVRGLRHMDACLAPWISTQYCWLDFEKTWEMANSVQRQVRCSQNYTANGAVYLESVLRNVNWNRLQSCWGSSLSTAIGTPLRQSDKGTKWWASIQSTSQTMTESDEVSYWQSFGVSLFSTDWQNYKSIGIIDTFNVQNAFGISYPMTLKYTNGSMQLSTQTSLKMYWSFASDLWAVTSSTSGMGGASLLRGTPHFAFASKSMADILVLNGTLAASDLVTGALSTFGQAIGPLGSVDLKRIPPPASLIAFILTVKDAIAEMRAQSAVVNSEYLKLKANLQFPYSPDAWLVDNPAQLTVGGNIFCNEVPAASVVSGLFVFSGGIRSCSSQLGETLVPPTMARLVAVVGAQYTRSTPLTTNQSTAICSQIRDTMAVKCPTVLLNQPTGFLRNTSLLPDPALVTMWEDLASTAQADMYQTKVEIMQYGTTPTSPATTLLRHEVFDPMFPNFHYLGWLLAYDWALNYREVISFQGDVDTINVMTSATYDSTSLVDPLEIPVNVAYYIRYACIYVTCVIICVAALAMAYLVLNRGRVEGLNLFELNRVAGIVWIGRTFLFIRSMAAMSLLSTQVLSLVSVNNLWRFVSPSALQGESSADRTAIRIFTTILAAGEVSWFVFVLNDVLMVFTQQYTTAYVFKCKYLVWGLSVILSLAAPSTHTATFDRKCEYAQVDFQLVCSSGTVAIGSYIRFWTLMGICIGSVLICYLYERVAQPKLPPPPQNSLFLASSAKFVFDPERWVDHEVYYIDPASAVINGILSVRSNTTFYIFDLKIWRMFVIQESEAKRKQLEQDGDLHLLSAIPLTD
ncbi:hypothetical protein H257_11815 [Aphanomyces astaci]|uniref:Uncharacterized protein n=1 Tax=Aphanomyces astaci TaxID=112090 RepID=W4G2K2_APHAT|nr:hypothetical protein H257_11815 [Aphanomyces astaci]ETV73274.1 hypothetical protein H257_11815 [Aphanomyces astaci]|eukprot:XP_009837149.1 hypothetical protein H257_11815 [Aphanomyces astaci]